jgi:periplasmic protein TonB
MSVRILLAYLTSLVCHAVVLVPLAHLSAPSSLPPAYAVGRGHQAIALQASLPESEDDTERVVQTYRQATIELAVPLEPSAMEAVLPTTAPQHLPDILVDPPKPVLAKLPSPRPATSPDANHVSEKSPLPINAISLQWDDVREWCERFAGRVGETIFTAEASAATEGAEVDQLPRPLPTNPAPPYPSDALTRGIEGLVLLHLCIRADGTVGEASIHRSSGVASLDDSALRTVQQGWRFLPATSQGRAVPYQAILPVRFTIRRG